jgi:hypothetical protein
VTSPDHKVPVAVYGPHLPVDMLYGDLREMSMTHRLAMRCAAKVPGPFRVGEPMRVTDAQAKRYQRSREEMPF